MNTADEIANHEEDLQLLVSTKRGGKRPGRGRPKGTIKLIKTISGEELLEKYSGDIIGSYKIEALRKIARVFDFIPDLRDGSPRDGKILETWKLFFRGKGVPYLVTLRGKKKKLWKERIVSE